MKNKPLITVYITNYNYGEYIEHAIESVLEQTFQDFEIIIIDDGSTDNSKQIVEKYSSHPKIEVIFQQNKGLNVANNIAVRVAQGKYIMRLDADDYLDPNALLVLSNILEKDNNIGLVFPDYYLVDAEGTIISIENRHSFDKEVTLYDQPAHGACTMIRLDYLKAIGGYDEEFNCQDGYDIWLKFMRKYKVKNVKTPLFFYRQHADSLTKNENKILNTRQDIKRKYVNKNNSDEIRVLLIIPVRGKYHHGNDFALRKLNNKTILEWKLNAALSIKNESLIVISSPDHEIEKYININYKNDRILFHKRSEKLARLNVDLVQTVNEILLNEKIKRFKPFMFVILSLETPFIEPRSIDEAIHTMKIFSTDALISVRPENHMIFHHDGSGMKPILNQEKFSRLERETLYKYSGGIIACKVEHFLKHQKLISGKVGHIIVNKKSAHLIESNYDFKLAEYLSKNDD